MKRPMLHGSCVAGDRTGQKVAYPINMNPQCHLALQMGQIQIVHNLYGP